MISKIIIFVLFNSALLMGQNYLVRQSTNDYVDIIKPDLQSVFGQYKQSGSILIYDSKNKIYYSNDFDTANIGSLPASTFKIPNTIIAMELGIVSDESTILKWDGKPYDVKEWEKDMSLREAFKVSCVPCYQEIARKIGYSRMSEYLNKFNYDAMVFDSSTIDNFWLIGNSKVNLREQIQFLSRVYFMQLPISTMSREVLINIMVDDVNENYKIYAKTGWCTSVSPSIGWYVGFVETKDNVFFFANRITQNTTISTDDFLSLRKKITLASLKQLKIID